MAETIFERVRTLVLTLKNLIINFNAEDGEKGLSYSLGCNVSSVKAVRGQTVVEQIASCSNSSNRKERDRKSVV